MLISFDQLKPHLMEGTQVPGDHGVIELTNGRIAPVDSLALQINYLSEGLVIEKANHYLEDKRGKGSSANFDWTASVITTTLTNLRLGLSTGSVDAFLEVPVDGAKSLRMDLEISFNDILAVSV